MYNFYIFKDFSYYKFVIINEDGKTIFESRRKCESITKARIHALRWCDKYHVDAVELDPNLGDPAPRNDPASIDAQYKNAQARRAKRV